MTDRPILFSAPMVRAILAGQKTQTRRAWKVQPPAGVNIGWVPGKSTTPYGKAGDRLWVREAHWFFQDKHDPVTGYTPPVMTSEDVEFRADGESTRHGWRPSIHMPRWASRITLEITDTRIERLQAISEGDARAEGVAYDPGEGGFFWVPSLGCASDSAASSFRLLWTSINGAESWEANPWVWVVEFRRVEA